MKPYFADKAVKLFLGDTLDILKSIPKNSIDMIFADPPYNLSNGGFSCYAGKRVSVNKGKWDKSKGIEADFKFHFKWIKNCKRILKPNGSLWISGTYHSIYSCGYALQKQGWHILNDIAWFKPNATPHLACRMFAHAHENLIWAKKSKQAKQTFHYSDMKNGSFAKDFIKKPNKQMRSVWVINTPNNSEKKHGKHPTQKPELLLERIILASTNKDDLILDPFCGSASTGVVALKHNRRFVGIDLEKEYLDELAIPRIKDLINENNKYEKVENPNEENVIRL